MPFSFPRQEPSVAVAPPAWLPDSFPLHSSSAEVGAQGPSGQDPWEEHMGAPQRLAWGGLPACSPVADPWGA